ncbi:endonuclease [Alkalihalobacillus alcalophilus ATCC 27647 = CGMCC 1.3604]|uniref:Endonuclease n=1 Tax=Alkalihalobacillus alcalophilus ATCC 27647 = CGMCC 1.3604 TaxID=1218173 RepID=A0A4V3X8A1_ALKAL|nr:DUF6359 domain-containing protein [Alkalihalobacillus alcalophilus]MED1564135.1 DUF6359 domain-containing protein [Alkalihalobacillus alcalophilus]THG89492.1 endonuclease [Alkalihalobacillus alcalophilus ATCC 27647 = CGMCC 1.3604]
MKNQLWKKVIYLSLVFLLMFTHFLPALTPQVKAAEDVISVSEAIENNSGRATVEGYIVGTVTSATNFRLEPPFTTNTNLALADSPDETDLTKMIPVQLPAGNVRNGLNLVSNPGNYQAKVQITGNLQNYFSIPGLHSASSYQILEAGQEPPEEGDLELISIVEARTKSLDSQVIVQGVVTVDSSAISGNQYTTYIQDETAGINVFNFNQNQFPDLYEGDLIEVRGNLVEYNGLLEVVPVANGIEKISEGNPLPLPVEVTLADLNDPAIAEPLEGQLVTVHGFVQNIPSSPAGGGYNISFIDEDFQATTVRVMEGTNAIDSIEQGNWYEVTGVLSQFNTYQVLPRKASDFTLAELQPAPPSSEGTYESTVGRITDGDTIHLASPVLGSTAVRFLNMDTPETYHSVRNELDENQKYHGDEATEYMHELLSVGDEVIVEVGPEATDQYGRLLAQIIRKSDGLNINLEMVRAGYATTYFIWPVGNEDDYELFQSTVREAKEAELGIWNPENPLLEQPFEFRARETGNGLHRYVGHSDTMTYVEPENWKEVPVDKRVFFASSEEAEANGYLPFNEPQIPDEELISMQLLGMNDLHGKIDQTYNVTVGDDVLQVGRFDYVAAYLKQWEERNENTFIIHSGDMIGGSSPVAALFQDEPVIEMMNEIGFDFGTVGNHEFDEGTEELLRMVHGGDHPEGKGSEGYAGMDFPLVCANCVEKESGEHFLPPYEVVEVEGEQVAFVGVNTTDTVNMVVPDGIKDIDFTNEVEAVNEAVAELKEQGVRAIIVLAHMAASQSGETAVGPAADLARNVDDEVDIILAGHNHQIVNAIVDDTLIVQALDYGKAFAAIDVLIDPETGDIVEKEAEIVFVDQSKVEPDSAVGAILADYENRVAPILNEVVGVAAIDMIGDYSNDGDTPLGNLIADSMIWEMESDFALMNGGGIRDHLPAGEITFNRLFNILPFNNVLVKFELTGAELREILNAQITSYGPDFSIAGFSYTWDKDSLEVVDMFLPDGSALVEEATYTVTTNNYMAESNGDKYQLIGQYAKNLVTGPEDLEAFISFVKTFSEPIAYYPDGRIAEISTLPEEPGTPEEPEEPKEPGTDPEEPSELDYVVVEAIIVNGKITISTEMLRNLADDAILSIQMSDFKNSVTLSLTAEQAAILKEKNVTLEVVTGGITVAIPTSIFSGQQEINFFLSLNDRFHNEVSSVFELKLQEGEQFLTKFDKPITLIFNVDIESVSDLDKLQVYYLNEATNKWELVGGSYSDDHKVTATTDHFSLFTVLESTEEVLPEDTVDVPQKEGDNSKEELKEGGKGEGKEKEGGAESSKDKIEKGKVLPNTATSNYQLILIGAVLLLIAAGMMYQSKRLKV